MFSQDQIKSLILRKDELYKFLEIEDKQIEATALEDASQQNEFWNNPKKAQLLLKKLSSLQSWLNDYTSVTNNIDELSVLLELEASEEELNVQLQKTEESLKSSKSKRMSQM